MVTIKVPIVENNLCVGDTIFMCFNVIVHLNILWSESE